MMTHTNQNQLITQSLNELNIVKNSIAKVLFLGYGKNQTKIIDALISENCSVWHSEEKIQTAKGFDLVVSFGYRHILNKEVIHSSSAPIVNLHIAYLPYNRGAHPNFWSFYDGTPSGVSIHLIDEGIDTGPILFQKYVSFSDHEISFTQAYNRLIEEIENLFIDNLTAIVNKKYKAIPQRRKGTYHELADLPKEFNGWGSIISDEIIRLDSIAIESKYEKLLLIDEIEKIRNTNNVNWMDLLRLAIKTSPEEAKQLFKKINSDDNRISSLFEKLGE